MNFLEKEYSIYGIFFIYSILSWFGIIHIKKILNKIKKPISLALLMYFIKWLIMLSIVIFGIVSSHQDIWNDITSIERNDIIILVLLGVVFTIGRLLFYELLKYHDPRVIKISKYIIAMLVSSGALYVLKKKNFTTSRYFGFVLMAFGGYLFIN